MLAKYTVSQKRLTIFFVHTFVTLPNVDRFSKLFHHWIQQEICNTIVVMFPVARYLCSYTTLWNLKCHFYYFTTTAVTKHTSKLLFIYLFNVIHITLHVLPWHAPDSTVTVCHIRGLLWVLYLQAKQSVSSMSVHSRRVSVSHLRLLKWKTPTFIWSGLRLQHPDLDPVNYKICLEI